MHAQTDRQLWNQLCRDFRRVFETDDEQLVDLMSVADRRRAAPRRSEPRREPRAANDD